MLLNTVSAALWFLSWAAQPASGSVSDGGLNEPASRPSNSPRRNPGERAPDDPAVANEISKMLETQAADWNRGDLEAFCSAYAENAMFLSASGVATGRQAVLAHYKKRYPDKKHMGALSFELISTRLRPNFASVAARWKLTYPDKQKTGLTLLVLEREGPSWKIIQDASM
jgi:beta-aspartyl-peptidase (threonine type)